MPALILTSAERKSRRADAHHLDPVVAIGNDGLTDAVVREADLALKAHGLIKVRAFVDDRAQRQSLLETLADRLDAAPIQHIGKLLVLWRPLPPPGKPERDDRMPGPRTVKVVKFSKSGNHRATVKKLRVLGNERVTTGGLVKRSKPPRAGSIKKKAQD